MDLNVTLKLPDVGNTPLLAGLPEVCPDFAVLIKSLSRFGVAAERDRGETFRALDAAGAK
ncbi:hypothetical protein [Pseudophaeobacter sp. C1-32P7]|uniref:hypothetical protein n=1 Tax=Pseudophaeobacter sp. C1-32P7 TaxID=3098142 RepID=UPI0034D43150